MSQGNLPIPPDYEDLDYETVQAGLNEYDLADGITVRGQILLTKIKRDPRDHRRINADTVVHWTIHAPVGMRGTPNMRESRSDEKHLMRVIRHHEPWSIYRIPQTGQVLKIKLVLGGAYSFKDAYDKDGCPRYDIQSTAKVLAKDSPEPKFKLIPDDAIERTGQDKFRHGVFVTWLLSALESADKPINIGLFGKWGTGKTGILQLFQDRVESKPEYKEKYQYCHIDCWKISPDHIRQQMLLEINKLLNVFSEDKMMNHLYHITETRDSDSKTKYLEKIKKFPKSLIILPSVITLITVTEIVYNWFPLDGDTSYKLALLTIPVIIPFVIRALQNNRVQHITQIPPISSHEEFRKLFDRLVESTKKSDDNGKKLFGVIVKLRKLFNKIESKQSDDNGKKLIIALDNLDRCSGDVMLEILSLVKSFMERPCVFFIIPCDIDAITEHLESKNIFREKETARDFLRKIFQVYVTIPPISPGSMKDYVRGLIKEHGIDPDNKVTDVISMAFMNNPRRIKQFLNQYMANYYLALEMEESDSLRPGAITSNPGFLTKILVLQDMFPDFYDKLVEDESLLDYAEIYFRNLPRSKYVEEKIKPILESNRLQEFLKKTRGTQPDDIRPFLRLTQDPDEQSSIYTKIRNNTQLGNYNEIIETVRFDQDKLEKSLEIIKKTINEDLEKGDYESGRHGLNVILRIHEIASESWKLDLVEFFGMHAASTKEILDQINIYDQKIVFRFVEKMENHANQNTILKKYCDTISQSNQPDDMTMSLLTTHSNLFSDLTTESYRNAIASFYNHKEPAAIALINQHFQEEHMITLLDTRIINSIIGKMSNDISDQNKQRIDAYFQLKQVADYIARRNFIMLLLNIIVLVDQTQIDNNLHFVLQILKNLEHDDIVEDGMNSAYDKLINIENRISDENQKSLILEPIMKHFHKLSGDRKDKFIGEKLRNCILWSDEPLTRLVSSMNLSEKKFLEHEGIFNAMFDAVKGNARRVLFEYLIENTTGDQREKIINLIISHIQSPSEAIRQQTCAAISNTYENLEEIDQLVPSIIDSSRHTEYPDRITILTLLDKVFVKCSLNMQNVITLEFIDLMKAANNRNTGRYCLNAIWPKLNNSQKSDAWDQLIKLLDEADIDSAPGPFFELVIDESKITQDNYHRISQFLISKAEQGINKEIYLEYLSNLGNMVQFDDATTERISKLQEK